MSSAKSGSSSQKAPQSENAAAAFSAIAAQRTEGLKVKSLQEYHREMAEK